MNLYVYLSAVDLNSQFLVLLQLEQLALGHRESVEKRFVLSLK